MLPRRHRSCHCRNTGGGDGVDSGYYAAFSGWLARSQALDGAAGNLANAGTAGYRAERDYFRSAILSPDALNSQLSTTINAFGVLGGSRLDMGQGALAPTGNPLDLAIEGNGFFAIETKQGIRYTRDGQFERAGDGTLTTQAGEPVLDARNQPVRLPAGAIAIGSDGAVSVNGAVAGRIALFGFSCSRRAEGRGGKSLHSRGRGRSHGRDGRPASGRARVLESGRDWREFAAGAHAAPGGDDAEGGFDVLERSRQGGERGFTARAVAGRETRRQM